MLALCALVLATYSNSFQAGLVFDNSEVISRDTRIRAVTPENVRRILTEGYSRATSGLYRPLTTFSYLLNYTVFGNGNHPAGYHWVNLTVHAANVLLVYLLGMLIFGESAPAFALAALWGVHPLLTESVTNVVGRADLLAAFGVLAGLLCYIRSACAAGRNKALWLAGMVAAQAIGLFSKENAAILPGLMLLYDLTWRGRAGWRERATAYAALILPFAAFFYARGTVPMHIAASNTDNPLMTADFWTARLTAIKVIGKYLWLFVWPGHLSADYSYNAVPMFGWHPADWEDAKALMALAICLAGAALAVRWHRTRKPLFFSLAFFFVALIPTSNLVVFIGSIMAERFVYLPSVGLAGCVIAGVYSVGRSLRVCHEITCSLAGNRSLTVAALKAERSRDREGAVGTVISERTLSRQVPSKRLFAMRTAWISLGLLCLACAARSYARNFDWLDERTLWTSAVNVCPESAKAHYNLGTVLSQVPGQLPDAIAQFEAALRINPDLAEAHDNLGKALSQTRGRMPDAIAQFEAAVRIDPNLAEAHSNLGNALSRQPGRLPEAIAQLEAAVRINPDFAEAHSNLGKALLQVPGRMPDAIAQFEAAVRINPDLAEAHSNLGTVLSQVPGRLPDAITQFEAAVRINPDLAEAHNNLGIALAQMPGRMPDAIAQFEAAVRINPDLAEAHNNLGRALAEVPGRLADAIAQFEAALRVNPDSAQTRERLNEALAKLHEQAGRSGGGR
jgi:tetratricopeptide (TPR) repeat protein